VREALVDEADAFAFVGYCAGLKGWAGGEGGDVVGGVGEKYVEGCAVLVCVCDDAAEEGCVGCAGAAG
jgi:hypothetical protein